MATSFLGLSFASITLCCVTGAVSAQIFDGNSAPIPDNGDTLEIPLEIMGLTTPLNALDLGLEQVCFTIQHEWIGELKIALVAPDGTTVLLAAAQGGPNNSYANTCFRQDAVLPITQGIPPFSGTYKPQQDLGTINNGQDGNGEWRLSVLDTIPGVNSGTVIAWALTFGDQPAIPFSFVSSDLPIVLINTDGTSIPEDEKITASMGIVDNGVGALNHPGDPFNNYDGVIGIRVRGNSSNYLSPKKSYSVELRDIFGEDLDASILGMPAESDWILLANYFDKSLMNNTLTYHLARAMGNYAPRQRDVEVVLNGEYLGVYALVEEIKRDGDRVDIAKLNPDEIAGDDLTGGYILRVDWFDGMDNGFVSPYAPAVSADGQQTYFEYRYPKPEDLVPEQKAYIQAYVDSFETALAGPGFADPMTGWRAYAEEASFVDMFLINELSRNVDGYRLSSFLYKDKDSNGGKLHDGPAWDYDIAWGNANYCFGDSTWGWAYAFGDVCPEQPVQVPFWWRRLMQDSAFVDAVRCRWNELRDSVLSPDYVSAYCDSVADLLDGAQQRNFTVWPILGVPVWANPVPVPATYAGEVQELKDFMDARWAWMDANLPGSSNCLPSAVAQLGTADIEAPYPNPFATAITFHTLTGSPLLVKLMDPLGRTILQAGSFQGKGDHHRIDLPNDLVPGTYILVVTTATGTTSAFRLIH
ncbi:MAG: CotH kinase family protein [Flavobacteriales bacterium]|nr:CotH kinase family protein [Flavobacteriales bacterium]